MKSKEPCSQGYESANPGAGAHYPDPCVRCSWSRTDHEGVEALRDARNEILMAVDDALAPLGLYIVRGVIDGKYVYQAEKVVTVVTSPEPTALPQPSQGWQPIETAPKSREVLVLIGLARHVAYQTDQEPPMINTWRRQNGEFLGWPSKWAEMPPLPAPPTDAPPAQEPE